jgi:hypothetical protein
MVQMAHRAHNKEQWAFTFVPQMFKQRSLRGSFLAHELLLLSFIRSDENAPHSIELVAGMIITNSIDLLNLKKAPFVISNKIK